MQPSDPAYNNLYQRYMAALNLQYTAYKEMLVGFAGNNRMKVNGVEKSSTGSDSHIFFAEPIPARATEAYLFFPPGYWASVYENPLYPDDCPSDLKASMNGGTNYTTVSGSSPDGHYLILYCINTVWYKTEYDINQGQITTINDRDVSYLAFDVTNGLGDVNIDSELDVNSAIMSDMDSELSVAVEDGSEIDGEMVVIYELSQDLDSDIFVVYYDQADLDCSMEVRTNNDIDSSLIVVQKATPDLDSEILVSVTDWSELDSELTVKYTLDTSIDCDILVTNSVDLDSEILVFRTDLAEIPSYINIQRTAYSDMDIEIAVYAYGVDSHRFLPSEIHVIRYDESTLDAEISVVTHTDNKLDGEIEIEAKNVDTQLDSEVTVKQYVKPEIDSEIIIVANNVMETVADIGPMNTSDLDSEINIFYYTQTEMNSEIFIPPGIQQMEAVTDIYLSTEALLDSEISIIYPGNAQLDSEIVVLGSNSSMEAVADKYQRVNADLDSEIAIVSYENADLDSTILVGFDSVQMEASIDRINTNGSSDLDAEITIVNHEEAALDAEIYITANTVMETIGTVQANATTELDSEINVVIHNYDELDSEIFVLANPTEMEALVDTVMTQATNDIDAEVTIKYDEHTDIDSEIMVVNNSVMEVVSDFMEYGISEIDSEISIVYYAVSDGPVCEILVNPDNFMEAAVFYRNDQTVDLDTDIIVTRDDTYVELDSEIYVTPVDPSQMEVTTLNLPPVIRTVTCDSAKDSVVYSATPYSNYGDLIEMGISHYSTGAQQKSFVGFDLAPLAIPHNYVDHNGIRKATLRLKTSRVTTDQNVVVKVYAVSYSWIENKITWSNHFRIPVLQEVGQFIAPTTAGEVSIDVTPAFTNWNMKPDQVSFMMTMEDATATKRGVSFFTKESVSSVPKLDVEYYKPYSNGNYTEIDSEMEINPNANLDIEMDVLAAKNAYLDSELEIAVQGIVDMDLNLDIEIVSNTYTFADLDSEIEVPAFWCHDQFDMELEVICWHDQAEIDASLIVDLSGFRPYVYII